MFNTPHLYSFQHISLEVEDHVINSDLLAGLLEN